VHANCGGFRQVVTARTRPAQLRNARTATLLIDHRPRSAHTALYA
jgi:hypothetical protein